MAARRLLIIMLILLGLSTLAATQVPPPREGDRAEPGTTSPRTSTVPRGGELVKAKLDASAKRPRTIHLEAGDQLALTVRSSEATQIEIKGLGLLDDVLPLSPARFDILATREGRFEIQRTEPKRRVGVIEVKGGPDEG